MRSPLPAALGALVFSCLPLAAQRATATLHEEHRQALPSASPAARAAWLERIEAELEFDAQLARASAEELAQVARADGAADVALVADELAALARAVTLGPARVPHARNELSSAAPPGLRSHLLLARARRNWLGAASNEVLADALGALSSARAADEDASVLRAAWFLHDLAENESPDLDAALLAELAARAHTPAAAAFECLRLLTDYWRTWASLSSAGRRAALEAAARVAEANGDVRGLVQVEWDLACLASEEHDLDAARRSLERARELAAAAGFLREEALSAQILAELAFDANDLELARRMLAESGRRLAGAGLVDDEVQQTHLELRLASATGDADGVVAGTARIEAKRQELDARHDADAAARQQLIAGELTRLTLERQSEQARRRNLRLAAGGGLVALLLLALLAGFSRRRLARANRRLRAEMERAESEARARAELEQRMRQLERAESLGLIASGVAHDFNNLMTGVLGGVELLRLRLHEPETRRHLDTIADSVERGARLCRQLQAYAGGQPAAFERVELGALLTGLAPALSGVAGAALRVTVEPCAAELATEADRSQLEQALLNLVANARDAGAHHVRLQARRERRQDEDWLAEFHRGEARAGEYLVLEVEDDGEGLSRELLERVFDPFFTTRFPGRGLGLAVVLGAVRRHHGVVSVASRPGQGARFRLYLPRLEVETERTVLRPAPTVPPAGVEPMEVLVVDDEARVAEFARAILEARGHRVLTTQDGAAAVARARELRGPRRVALIDLSMPVVDGRDVVRALRAEADPPALVLTSGHSSSHLLETARELATEGHLAKPFLAAELEAALAAALSAPARRRALERVPAP